jgi:hypothetical protein
MRQPTKRTGIYQSNCNLLKTFFVNPPQSLHCIVGSHQYNACSLNIASLINLHTDYSAINFVLWGRVALVVPTQLLVSANNLNEFSWRVSCIKFCWCRNEKEWESFIPMRHHWFNYLIFNLSNCIMKMCTEIGLSSNRCSEGGLIVSSLLLWHDSHSWLY